MDKKNAREAAGPVSAAVGVLSSIAALASGFLDPLIQAALLLGPTLMSVVGAGARFNRVVPVFPPWLVTAGIVIAVPLFAIALIVRLRRRADRLVDGD
jgi:NO-binding membrane sensor protein with MHYT domain